STVRCMASLELICFSPLVTMQRPIHRSGQDDAMGSAKLSIPSGLSPACHSTKPCHSDRQPLPLPSRAKMEPAVNESCHSNKRSSASTSAANPLAEEGKPDATGILDCVSTRKR